MTANNASSYYGNNECSIGCEATDTYDVNNNGSVGDKLMRVNTATLNILENKNLVVNTYIQPAGSDRQPPYDPANPSTAINFKL
jgi:hypothetical protein